MKEWGYAHCLPYFKRMETRLLVDGSVAADEWRGGDGPLVLEQGPAENPLFGAFFEAVQQAGYPLTDDVNGSFVAEIDEAGGRRRPRGRRGGVRRVPPRALADDVGARAGDLLLRVADLLERDAAEVALAESRTPASGWSRASTTSPTWSRCSATTATSRPRTPAGSSTPGATDVHSRVVHEPLGVCALITPWNYPLLQASGRSPLPRGRQHLRAQAERAHARTPASS